MYIIYHLYITSRAVTDSPSLNFAPLFSSSSPKDNGVQSSDPQRQTRLRESPWKPRPHSPQSTCGNRELFHQSQRGLKIKEKANHMNHSCLSEAFAIMSLWSTISMSSVCVSMCAFLNKYTTSSPVFYFEFTSIDCTNWSKKITPECLFWALLSHSALSIWFPERWNT